MIYIGIDIGRKGAIVFLNNSGTPYRCLEIKTGMDFHEFFDSFIAEQHDKVFLCIEQSISMKSDGHTNSWNNGYKFGENIMSLNLLKKKFEHFDYMTVHPASWKSSFKLTKEKALSGNLCVNLWGKDIAKMFTGKKGAFLDGIAEAMLIGWYGKNVVDKRLKFKIG